MFSVAPHPGDMVKATRPLQVGYTLERKNRSLTSMNRMDRISEWNLNQKSCSSCISMLNSP